jgi:hypothetical protein
MDGLPAILSVSISVGVLSFFLFRWSGFCFGYFCWEKQKKCHEQDGRGLA